MTYFERQLIKNGLRAFIQKEDRNNDIRYALILDSNNDGIMFGYEGGGEYSTTLIGNLKEIVLYDEDNEMHGFDENIEAWAALNNKDSNVIFDMVDTLDILGESFDGGCITLGDDYLPFFNDTTVFVHGDIEPINYANTAW